MNDIYKIDDDYYYVYEHWLNDEVIYIGKGKKDRAFRLDRNSHWHEKVKDNFKNIKVEIKGYFKSEEDALDFERLLIAKHLYEGSNITNIEYNFNRNRELKSNVKDIVSKNNRFQFNFDREVKNELKFSHQKQVLPLMRKLIKENKNNKVLFFFNPKYKSIISELKKEKIFKTLVLSKFYNDDFENIISSEKINEQLNKGLIPDPYNILLYPTDYLYFDKTEITDSRVKLVIMNERNESKNRIALNKIKNDIDILACKVEPDRMSKVSEMAITLPEEILNAPLTSDDKLELCRKLDMINSSGKLIKWRAVKKILLKNGYEIKNHTKTVNDKRMRVSTIFQKNKITSENISSNKITIPKEYLNTQLTAKDKDELCEKLNIINVNGKLSKWRMIRKLITSETSEYEVEDNTKTINGKRTRVSTILLKENNIE